MSWALRSSVFLFFKWFIVIAEIKYIYVNLRYIGSIRPMHIAHKVGCIQTVCLEIR